MQSTERSVTQLVRHVVDSRQLEREVLIDIYRTAEADETSPILMLNDGQDLVKMELRKILDELDQNRQIQPFNIVGIHCGEERKREYGVASTPDYKGRGDKASLYQQFITDELLPYLAVQGMRNFSGMGFAGFSLGGLSAIDIAWNHPQLFGIIGVFSGSLWWRSLPQEDEAYNDDQHRIMHRLISQSPGTPPMKFFFQCGNLDETRDRNQNGIIDSIDDTMDLVKILEEKGYQGGRDIQYLEIPDGKHDVATWSRALPLFLTWAYGRN